MLCSKHFEPKCFVVVGIHYRDSMASPAKRRLKPDAIPTIFPSALMAKTFLAFHVKGHPLRNFKDKR